MTRSLDLALALLVILATTCSDHSAATTRSAAVARSFQKAHPCPSTGKTTGSCPGYIKDHVYPLCLGGKDEVENMQWQTIEQSYIKDRLERAACACIIHHD